MRDVIYGRPNGNTSQTVSFKVNKSFATYASLSTPPLMCLHPLSPAFDHIDNSQTRTSPFQLKAEIKTVLIVFSMHLRNIISIIIFGRKNY